MKEIFSKVDWALVLLWVCVVLISVTACTGIVSADRVERAVRELKTADSGYHDKYFELKGRYEGFAKGFEYPPVPSGGK